MSVLVLAENPKGKFKKPAFEAVYYGHLTAKALGVECIALVLGAAENPGQLGTYGASKVIHLSDSSFDSYDSRRYLAAVTQVAQQTGASAVVLNHSSTGKSLLGGLSITLNAGVVSGVNSIPTTDNGFSVKKNVFGGKAIAEVNISTDVKVLSLVGNSIPLEEVATDAAPVESLQVDLPEAKTTVTGQKTVDGIVPLPEAELVVSAGRGMKGPENWGIIEDLANVLGATTACSRPVADDDWRPHHEHVGQTGVAIRPNLYIAAGISGAIQHLAGVNSSKTIVVINIDPEAPFFKAADYGVCADLFDVVPALTEAIKNFKASN
jgi:electron transfer flavoprotein alpha subunit